MSDTTNTPPDDVAMQDPGLVEMADLNQFVDTLTKWHRLQIAQLMHMRQVPPGVEMEVTNSKTGETKTIKVEGDFRDGFIMGIGYALSLIGELPFVAELEDVPADPSVPSESNSNAPAD